MGPYCTEDRPDLGPEQARQYRELKSASTLSLVDFTELPAEDLQKLASTVERTLKESTGDRYGVRVEVHSASRLARAVYARLNPAGTVHLASRERRASTVAAATMPELRGARSTVVALTDSRLRYRGADPQGSADSSQAFADVGPVASWWREFRFDSGRDHGFAEGYPWPNSPAQVIVHEWWHALARLGHYRTAYGPEGTIGQYGIPRGNLLAYDVVGFAALATVEEHGRGIMGDAWYAENAELTAGQRYLTESAERCLREPLSVEVKTLENDDLAFDDSPTDTVIAIPLASPLDFAGSGEGINAVTELLLTPRREPGAFAGEYRWIVDVDAATIDLALIELGHLEPVHREARAFQLSLPDDTSVTVREDEAGKLHLSID